MMHHRFSRALTCAAVTVLTLAPTGCRWARNAEPADPVAVVAAEPPAKPAAPLPLLVVDTDAPLLLDESAEPAQAEFVDGADNSHCLVCHANYRHEPLAKTHAAADMGCVACHGDSFDHRNDENNTTPPESMFARDVIDAACGKCHKNHDVAPAKVVALFKERGLDEIGETPVCTDCHGDHRLKLRTVRWNKKTGELL